jgi:transposase InsO family protein
MAWKDVGVSEQRIRFVLRASSGQEEMAGLCREFGISRTTGYHWLKRYQQCERIEELRERSRRPLHSPGKTEARIEQRVVEERQRRPDWGARKLRVLLQREGIEKPEGTIHRILRRHHLIQPHQQHPSALKRFQREQPNQLWQMDFKGLPANLSRGWMPLSILDDCSRYALALEALAGAHGKPVQQILERVFAEAGVPDGMLLDHGTPWWSAHHPCGWTRLTIWLMKRNVQLHFSAIRHPQTQGKVERFHRSLQDALHERGFPASRPAWPAWLEAFRQEYNQVRPHEALGMATPASRWQPSTRHWEAEPPEWEYAPGHEVLTVRSWGQVRVRGHEFTITSALAGERVQLQQIDTDRVLVYYRRTCVRELNLRKRQSYPVYFSREHRIFED